jgi:hypothetical protein
MDEAQLRLDGNAAGGMFGNIFATDLTAARGACAACGAVAAMGSQYLYMTPLSPGAVVRCRSCESVLAVVVHANGCYRVGLRGLTWLEMTDGEEASAAT